MRTAHEKACPLWPLVLGLGLSLVVAAGPALAHPNAAQQPLVEDYIAPGYPLHEGDRPYTGFGTMPNAPLILGGRDSAREKDASDALADREGKRLLEDLKGRRAGDRKAEARERAQNARDAALRQAAGTMAFQKAVRHGYGLLRAQCEARAHVFDRIFNFRQLLLEGRVLPPVILWMGPATRLEPEDAARSVEASYRIARPARLVSRAPSWRDYIMADFAALEPAQGYLPKNSHEEEVWKEGVDQGWQEGLEQAQELFGMNMARLVADYRGMLRFHMLAQKGMVSMPRLAEGKLGLKVGKRTLDINETIFRITVPAGFLPAEAWQDRAALP